MIRRPGSLCKGWMLSANWKSGKNIEQTQIASQWKVVLHLRQTLGEFLAHRRPVDVACDHGGPACSAQDTGASQKCKAIAQARLAHETMPRYASGSCSSCSWRSCFILDAIWRDTRGEMPPTSVLIEWSPSNLTITDRHTCWSSDRDRIRGLVSYGMRWILSLEHVVHILCCPVFVIDCHSFIGWCGFLF